MKWATITSTSVDNYHSFEWVGRPYWLCQFSRQAEGHSSYWLPLATFGLRPVYSDPIRDITVYARAGGIWRLSFLWHKMRSKYRPQPTRTSIVPDDRPWYSPPDDLPFL